jgi:hypothetical protein
MSRRAAPAALATAPVEDFLDVGAGVALGAAQLARLDEVAVLARHADGESTGLVDGADDLLVDGAAEDHLDDVHGLGVGDAQAVDEGALDLQALQHGADLRTAAMDNNGIDADLLEQDDVAGESLGHGVVAHGMTAVFHKDGFARVLTHIRQRIGQDAGLRQPFCSIVALRHRSSGSCVKEGYCLLWPGQF